MAKVRTCVLTEILVTKFRFSKRNYVTISSKKKGNFKNVIFVTCNIATCRAG